MTYTQDGIMAQIWVAFGQGTGTIRVAQDAAMELHRLYYNAITKKIVDETWKTEKVPVLERIRAIGRLAESSAVKRGSTVISATEVYDAAVQVQATSDTWLCPTPAEMPARPEVQPDEPASE